MANFGIPGSLEVANGVRVFSRLLRRGVNPDSRTIPNRSTPDVRVKWKLGEKSKDQRPALM